MNRDRSNMHGYGTNYEGTNVGMGQGVDPVCGMTVDCSTTSNKSEFQGQTYCFCSSDCKSDFERNPEQFIHR